MAVINFSGGSEGEWAVTSIAAVVGAGLPPAARLAIGAAPVAGAAWSLSGATSHLRYTRAGERAELLAKSAPLGRTEARCGALLPISKSEAWWALAQDERQAIYDRSAHTAIGMDYLPGIARRLHHGRDLGAEFDFLTWFDFAPEDEPAFDRLLEKLRATEEWLYVTREVDVRVRRG